MITIHIPTWAGWTLVAAVYFIGMVITSRVVRFMFMDAGPTGHDVLDGVLMGLGILFWPAAWIISAVLIVIIFIFGLLLPRE